MERVLKYRLDHILFWTATVAFHMFTRIEMIDRAGVGQFLLEVVVRNTLLAIIIYANLLVFIPRFALAKKWPAYLISLLLAFAFYVLMKNVHDMYLYGAELQDTGWRSFFTPSFYNFSIALFYLAFSAALQLSREWFEQRELIRKIEVEKLNTELDYLKAQINPHFLFNSINTIYFQIDRENTRARETLASFSNMLRYQLYECNGKEIPIEKEVTYLKNYVDIQRLRKDKNHTITFAHNNMRSFTIAPLLLIPFVENAFKHVSHHETGNEIKIDLTRLENSLRLKVFNTYDESTHAHETGHGIGLKNVQRRLELLYKDRHRLVIHQHPDNFQVDLEINITAP